MVFVINLVPLRTQSSVPIFTWEQDYWSGLPFPSPFIHNELLQLKNKTNNPIFKVGKTFENTLHKENLLHKEDRQMSNKHI